MEMASRVTWISSSAPRLLRGCFSLFGCTVWSKHKQCHFWHLEQSIYLPMTLSLSFQVRRGATTWLIYAVKKNVLVSTSTGHISGSRLAQTTKLDSICIYMKWRFRIKNVRQRGRTIEGVMSWLKFTMTELLVNYNSGSRLNQTTKLDSISIYMKWRFQIKNVRQRKRIFGGVMSC